MTHFGILCPHFTGHLNTILPVGQELRQRGHRVTLFGILDIQAKTLAAGLEFQPIGIVEFPLGWAARQNAQLGKLTGKDAAIFTGSLGQSFTPVLLHEAPELLKQAGIEALIVDYGEKGGGTVAERLNIPFITICSSLIPRNYGQARGQGSIFGVLNTYRHQWGLPVYSSGNDYYSSLLQLSHQPAEFDIPRTSRLALPNCFHFTGPYHSATHRKPVPFPWEKLNGKRLVYASLGTLQNRLLTTFEYIAQACQGLDVQLVMSLGGGIKPESLPPLPGNPLVVSYAPQLELLKKATLTVTHAGMNTTLESLSQGVPIVAIPVTNDQPAVAARVVLKGAGVGLPLSRLNVPRLREAIETVLNDDSYRQKAVQLQQAISNSGGVKKAADLIEKAISTGKPVLGSQGQKLRNKKDIVKPSTADDQYLQLLENVDFQPIFILGAHRSGTTLLYQILSATGCFNYINAYHVIKYDEILSNYIQEKESLARQELQQLFQSLAITDRIIDRVEVTPDLPEEYGFILANSGYNFRIDPDNLFAFMTVGKKLQFISNNRKELLLKNPWDFANFLYLKSVFPTAKFIFIHRNPLHVINSQLKLADSLWSSYSPYNALVNKKYEQSFHDPHKKAQVLAPNFLAQRLMKITSGATNYTSYFVDKIEKMSPTNYISVKYEDLCQEPRLYIQKILNFLGLEPQVKLDYHNLISPRPLQLLPQVETERDRIYQQLQTYCQMHNYHI